MPLNVLMLSPHFPPGFHRFCARLTALGARVLGVGDAPAGSIPAEILRSVAEYHSVPDLADVDALEALCRRLIERHGPIHRLDSHSEHWLGVEAELRQRLGVPGQLPGDLAINRHKIAMTQRFREAGIPCAPGAVVGEPGALEALVEAVGFPLILKPDVGVGALGAMRIDDAAALEAALPTLRGPYLAEAFVRGDVVSYDGLADAAGQIVFATAHVNCAGVLECRQDQLQTWYHSLRDIPEELERLGRRVVEAFGVRERFFHAEFFRRPDGGFQAIEINVRPPGGFTLDLMNLACDQDLYSWWARMILGEPLPERYQRLFLAAHVARRDGLTYAHRPSTVAAWLGPALCHHGRVPEVFAEAMGDEVYLIRERSLGSLQADIAFIQRLA